MVCVQRVTTVAPQVLLDHLACVRQDPIVQVATQQAQVENQNIGFFFPQIVELICSYCHWKTLMNTT